MSVAPAPAPTPIPAAPTRWLFLDVDGVLNRLQPQPQDDAAEGERRRRKREKKERKEKRRKRKEEQEETETDANETTGATPQPPLIEPFHSPLPCVPSSATIARLLHAAQLSDSLDAQLLHHLCHAMHAHCCDAAQSDTATPDAGSSPPAPASVQLVLTSTWRLEPNSLQQLQKLFVELGLAASPDGYAPAASGCRFQPQALLQTPDLKGWGARLEEIFAFFQAQSLQQQLQRGQGAFLLLDDMDLFAGVSLQGAGEGEVARLLQECATRSMKLDGERGFDAQGLERALQLLSVPPPNAAFFEAVATYKLPQCPY